MASDPSREPKLSEQDRQQHLADLGRLAVRIPCETPSDALLASLSVAKDMDSLTMGAILSLLRNPSFNSKDVTFSSFEDLSQYISTQRQRLAHSRSLQVSHSQASPHGSGGNGVVPELILELVAKQLARERTPMVDRIDWDVNVFSSTSQRCPRTIDLRNMALVHRTWTLPAQAVLRTRADIVGTKNLRAFFRSLYAGPWLKDVYFATLLDGENPDEMIELLKCLLQKCPNLRTLCLYTSFRLHHYFDPYSFGLVIAQLKHMQSLESLWLVQDRGHVSCLPILCSVLPNLRNLKHLYIKNWMGKWVGTMNTDSRVEIDREALECQLTTTAGGLELTSLSFVDGRPGDLEMTAPFIPWLFRKPESKLAARNASSTSQCTLRHLEIHTKDLHTEIPSMMTPLHKSLRPLLPNVATLRLHCSAIYLQGTLDFVNACRSLKTLSLVVGLSTDFSQFLLPETIEHIHVHFCTIWPVNGLFIKERLEDLNMLPNLKTLKLTKDPLDILQDAALVPNEVERMAAAWHIDELAAVCRARSIQLTNAYEFISFAQLSNFTAIED